MDSPSPIQALLARSAPSLDWLDALGSHTFDSTAPNAALQDLLSALDEDDELRQKSSEAIRELLSGRSARRLLGSAGLPRQQGLVSEVLGRIADRFLPSAPREPDLADLVETLLDREERIRAILSLEPGKVATLLDLWEQPFDAFRPAAEDALRLVGIRVAAMGLADDLHCFDAFSELARRADRAAADPTDRNGLLEAIGKCREALASQSAATEEEGVSVDRVYRLETIGKGLDRIAKLSKMLSAGSVRAGLELAAGLATDHLQEKGVVGLVQRNTQLLSRRISEHSGETGEHYITSTRKDWLEMLARACGGGVLTAGTALAKFLIAGLGLALFPEAILAAMNYAGSFLLMQALGFTLATKQPSMTAAALVKSLRQDPTGENLDGIVETTVRITRSQVAAAAGNLLAVIPAALAVDLAWRAWKGAPILDAAGAGYAMGSLNPFTTGTIPFAVLTGFLLWASSLAAGAAHNWALVRRLPEGIAASRRIQRWMGKRGAAWLGRSVGSGMAGIAGNAGLGILLALTPMAGKFLGVPLDVRHVTLSTGGLALAISSLGPAAIFSSAFLAAVAGIGVIACLNFGVSFALALGVATRAQGLSVTDKKRLTSAIWARFRRTPRDFIVPRGVAPATPQAPAAE